LAGNAEVIIPNIAIAPRTFNRCVFLDIVSAPFIEQN
jgi:hypothetical protein